MRGLRPSKIFLRNVPHENSFQFFWFVSNIFIRKMAEVSTFPVNLQKGSTDGLKKFVERFSMKSLWMTFRKKTYVSDVVISKMFDAPVYETL